MQEGGLKARTRKRFTLTTMSDHDQPVAPNLLDRQLDAAAPNQRWVGDTTEFVIGSSGKLYLAVVLDLFSRFAVGWAVSAVNDHHLTIKALEMALKRRCPEIGLLHHSDQGCTGEFKWSSQHLESEELRWEQESVDALIVRDALRCGPRSSTGGAAGASEAILGGDCARVVERGCWGGGRCVAGGRHEVVPREWRDAVKQSGPAVGALSVVRRTRSDRDLARSGLRDS